MLTQAAGMDLLWAALALLAFYFSGKVTARICYKSVSHVRRRIDAWRYLLSGADMITAGYKRASGKAFEIPGPDHNHVFITSSEHMGEIRKAGRDVLSLFGATKQMFQPAYTMLGHNWVDERGAEGTGYVRAVGTLFPKQLIQIMPEMKAIVQKAFTDFTEANSLQRDDGNLPAYKLSKTILCKLNGFCFFGDELAKNELFMEKIFEYNELVIFAGEILRLLPDSMKGIIGPYIARSSSVQGTVFQMIDDLVLRRMEQKRLREAGEISSAPPSDMVQWIIDTAPAHLGWGSRRVTYEIIAIWFGSVHALSATVTYVLFDLCMYPEYLEPLREEAESAELDYFMRTTKGLPLLDSFIKESSRVNPIETMSGRRQALKDFAFSDGTQVKKGDWACVPVKAILNDEAYFPEASSFKGFRFAPRDKIPGNVETLIQPEGPSRYSDLSENNHTWGIGGIVCPGRFYAAISMKLIVVHILKEYDFKLVDHSRERSSTWRSYVLPREDALMQFSPRL